MIIRPIRDGESGRCEGILRSLPEWFGIESALVGYVEATGRLATWIAEEAAVGGEGRAVGFVTLRVHNPRAAEIHCIAVRAGEHRRGVGRAMVEFSIGWARERGVEYLQVKTMGPSRPNEHYARTRVFYEQMGFVAIEELLEFWPGNPCLVMVMKV